MMMVKRFALVGIMAWLAAACVTTNEVTGRSQFITIPPAQDDALGLEAMNQVKSEAPVRTTGPDARRVQRIGARIAAISDRPDFNWEFVVIDEPVLNAWALPGGKVAIYKKMVDTFPEDDMLAAVIGHEIAHAVLRHGAEQVSRGQLTNTVLAAAGLAVGTATGDGQSTQLAMTLGTLAAQGFVMLPHGRAMELEADHVGTIYMAKAGYDPRRAVDLWRRMQTMKDGNGGPPAFLSTHPTDDKRIARLEANMPDYLAVYAPR